MQKTIFFLYMAGRGLVLLKTQTLEEASLLGLNLLSCTCQQLHCSSWLRPWLSSQAPKPIIESSKEIMRDFLLAYLVL